MCRQCADTQAAHVKEKRAIKRAAFLAANGGVDGRTLRWLRVPESNSRRCYCCNKTKLIDEFASQGSGDGRHKNICKACDCDRAAKWAGENGDKRRLVYKRRDLKRRFGITLAERDQMGVDQGFKCAICEKPESECLDKRLCVDHDHDTKFIRALLCADCNMALGTFKDSPDLLRKAALYLESFQKD